MDGRGGGRVGGGGGCRSETYQMNIGLTLEIYKQEGYVLFSLVHSYLPSNTRDPINTL